MSGTVSTYTAINQNTEKCCTYCMYGYMEVVCLIFGPTLTSQPCLHAFRVLTSLHLPSFLLKIILVLINMGVFVINYPLNV